MAIITRITPSVPTEQLPRQNHLTVQALCEFLRHKTMWQTHNDIATAFGVTPARASAVCRLAWYQGKVFRNNLRPLGYLLRRHGRGG